jgi:hypothetical protein
MSYPRAEKQLIDELTWRFDLDKTLSRKSVIKLFHEHGGLRGAAAYLKKVGWKERPLICTYCGLDGKLTRVEGVEGPILLHADCNQKMRRERSPLLFRDRGQAAPVVVVSEEWRPAETRMRTFPTGVPAQAVIRKR